MDEFSYLAILLDRLEMQTFEVMAVAKELGRDNVLDNRAFLEAQEVIRHSNAIRAEISKARAKATDPLPLHIGCGTKDGAIAIPY